jgi:phosphoserine phosphatase
VTTPPRAAVPHLVTVSGQDAPGIARALFGALAAEQVAVEDVEQVRVHGRLLLCVEVRVRAEAAAGLRDALGAALGSAHGGAGVEVAIESLRDREGGDEDAGGGGSEDGEMGGPDGGVQLVTVLAPEVDAAVLAGVTGCVAACGGNIERIVRLAAYPVHSYELSVAGADLGRLRRALAEEAARFRVDLAVQPAGLHRRAKHLIVLDADSTLLQGEVIDLLAERAGRGAEVAALTEAAMTGQVDFTEALRRRVRLLAGLGSADLDAVRSSLLLAPGARTLVRTLKRLGYELAVVSGGFTQVIEPLVRELGIDHLAANTLVLERGQVTGELAGPLVDRPGKADALRTFAAAAGVPLARTIAVGDGANDIDMLAAAGLGIAFNAKPVVRQAADTAVNVPYLDAILFLLGISRREIELADRSGS